MQFLMNSLYAKQPVLGRERAPWSLNCQSQGQNEKRPKGPAATVKQQDGKRLN